MDGVALDADVAVNTMESRDHFVMVAGDVNDPCAFARFAQDFLDDVVVLLRPINPATELPDINQITHNVESLEFVFAQEIKQCARVAAARAEMDIGDPSGANAPWLQSEPVA